MYKKKLFKPLPFSRRIQQKLNWWHFSYFSKKTGFDISCKLSPVETICMKCQNLFSGKTKQNILKCCLLGILPRLLSVNHKCSYKYAWSNSVDSDQSAHSGSTLFATQPTWFSHSIRPQHEKPYLWICWPIKTNNPAHSSSLIRTFFELFR